MRHGGQAKFFLFNGLMIVTAFETVCRFLSNYIEEYFSHTFSKMMSAVVAMAISFAIKTIGGRIIRAILCKGGNIMEKVKAFFKWLVANKKSLSSTVVNALGTGLGVTAIWTIDSIPSIILNEFDIAPILYTAICAIAFALNELGICGKGFESIKTYVERRAVEKAEADAKAIEHAALKQIEAEEAEAKAIEAAAKKQLLEEEERAKEQARAALIEKKKAEILASSK